MPFCYAQFHTEMSQFFLIIHFFCKDYSNLLYLSKIEFLHEEIIIL